MRTQRKRNPGWFKKGHDPRRHQLTEAERRKGYRVALSRLSAWTPLEECRWLLWRAKEARKRSQQRAAAR